MVKFEKKAIETLMKYLMSRPMQEVAGLFVYQEVNGNMQVTLRGLIGDIEEKKPKLSLVEKK